MRPRRGGDIRQVAEPRHGTNVPGSAARGRPTAGWEAFARTGRTAARPTLGLSTSWRSGDLVYDDNTFAMHEIRRLAAALVEILATSRLEGSDPETQLALMEPIFAEYSRTVRVTPGRGIDVTAIVGSGAVIAAFLIDMLEDLGWALDRPPSHPQIIAELRRRTFDL
jgi:hypothetical protein